MTEKNLVINNRELNYSGKFVVDDLFLTINKVLSDQGYAKAEKLTEEKVTEKGRSTYIELRPAKRKTNYVTLMFKIKIKLDMITEEIAELGGVRRKFHQGDVKVIIDAWSMTDYENRWGMKPWTYFLKGAINKYLYTWPMESGFLGELKSDAGYLTSAIQKLFASYKKQEKILTPEEQVRAEVAAEVAAEMTKNLEE